MARAKLPPSATRPLPFLADAVEPKLRPMMEGLYHGLSIRGWSAMQQAMVENWPRVFRDPKLTKWLPGASSSAVDRAHQSAKRQLLAEFNGRSLEHLDLAAIVVDGTPVGGEQLVWAIGVTFDGDKVPLGVASGPAESGEFVEKFVADLQIRRGLDTDHALWVVDAGSGLRAGIRRATRGRAAIQLCRVHRQRNVLRPLTAAQRETHHREIIEKLQRAWAQPSHEVAARELEEVARWLEQDVAATYEGPKLERERQRLRDAAAALRNDIDLTLTLQRIGIEDPRMLRKLSTTNLLESANNSVSRIKRKVTTWRAEEGSSPRKGAVAVAVAGVERSWNRLGIERSKLESVSLAVLRSRHFRGVEWVTAAADGTVMVQTLPGGERDASPALRDLLSWADRTGKTVTLQEGAFADVGVAEAMRPWLEECGFVDGVRAPRPRGSVAWTKVAPIELHTRSLPVPSGEEAAATAQVVASAALGLDRAGAGELGGLTCTGSAEALAQLGLRPGEVTIEQLTTALAGRHVSENSTVRQGTPQKLRDAEGQLTGDDLQCVTSVAWELPAPAAVTERWLLADPAGRERIERTLVAGAEAGLHKLFDDRDIAAALVVDRGDHDTPALRVRGVVLGVLEDGKLVPPKGELPKESLLSRAQADAGDIAAAMLDVELARIGPTAGVTLPRGLDEPWTTQDHLAVLGQRRADRLLTAARTRYGDVLADWTVETLLAARDAAIEEDRAGENPFAHLDRAGAAEAAMLEKSIAELEAAGREGPALRMLDQRVRELRRDGRHPNSWYESRGDQAIRRLALERECEARAGAIARDGRVVHRLEAYRAAPGGRRPSQLTEQAQGSAKALERQATERLPSAEPAPSTTRPLPFLADAVEPKLRPMMEGLYHGLSIRGWSAVQQAMLDNWPQLRSDPTLETWLPAASASAVDRAHQSAKRQLLAEFNGRSLEHLDLAAIVVDGTPVGGEQLVWAIGVTFDGDKVPLGVASVPSERGEFIEEFIADLQIRRGLDTDHALWIVDAGTGLRAGIRRATRGRAAIQLCRVHRQRNVFGPLTAAQREAHHHEIRDKLRRAWAQPSHEVAARELEEVARWLEQDVAATYEGPKLENERQRLRDAAAALRNDIDLTLTLQRIGIEDPKLLRKLGTTNLLESANNSISKIKKKVTRWREEQGSSPRKGAVAVAVAAVERNWKPLGIERSKLESLSLAVLRSRHFHGVEWVTAAADGTLAVQTLPGREHEASSALRDLLEWTDRAGKTVTLREGVFADASVGEAMQPWLEKCGFVDDVREPQPRGSVAWTKVAPIDLEVRSLPVPSGKEATARAREIASAALGVDRAGASGALTCMGAPAALAQLGLRPGDVTFEQLATALAGRHVGEGRIVRQGTPQKLRDGDGKLVGDDIHCVTSVAWELPAPAAVTERWLLADPAGRERIERTLVAGAEAGLRQIFGDEDLAAALVVDRGDHDTPALRVRGVVLGVLQDGKLLPPWSLLPKESVLQRAQADAGDIAAAMLDVELARMGPTAGVALPRGLDEPWTTQDYLAVLGQRRADRLLDEARERYGHVLQDWTMETLLAAREQAIEEDRTGQNPFARLDRAGAAEAAVIEARIAELRAAGRDGADLRMLDQRLRELRREGRHPNPWYKSRGDHAIRRIALEHECEARAGAIAQDGGIVARLEPYRELLGGRRLRRLTEHAQRRAEALQDRTTEWLLARERELSAEVQPLDKEAARTLRGIEHERARLDQTRDAPRDKEERLQRLARDEQGLRRGGRHPAVWMTEHGKAAAERVAVRVLLNASERATELAAALAVEQQQLAARVLKPPAAGIGMG